MREVVVGGGGGAGSSEAGKDRAGDGGWKGMKGLSLCLTL